MGGNSASSMLYSSILPMPSPTTLSLLPISKSLPKTKPWLSVGLKAAILAVPLFLAAPSEAATVSVNVSGFNGEFAPGEWTRTTAFGSFTNFLDSNTLRLARNSNLANIAPPSSPQDTFAFRPLNNALFTNLKTSNPLAGNLISFSYKYDYSWTARSILFVPEVANSNFDFTTRPYGTKLNPSSASGGIFTSSPILASSLDTEVGWQIVSQIQQNGVGEAFITNFEFTALYDEVPGPLPILGAGAAFGFSRKLRRRLNSAKAVA
jgi:hypothetical protein